MYHKLKFEVEYLTEEHLTGFESYKVSVRFCVYILFVRRKY